MIALLFAFVLSSVLGPAVLPEKYMPPMPPQPRIWITAYQPAMGGINCGGSCDWTAIGLRTGDHLNGRAAACPSEWLGIPRKDLQGNVIEWKTSVIYFSNGLAPRYCIDAFGHPRNREALFDSGEWVLRMDFYESDPFAFAWNQQRVSNWIRRWEDVPENWWN